MAADDRGIPTGEVADAPVEPGPLGSRSFDDLFADGVGAWLTLRGGGRELTVRFGEGYTHAQLFVDQDQRLLAFEPMMAPTDALRSGRDLRSVAPGQEARASFAISVRDV